MTHAATRGCGQVAGVGEKRTRVKGDVPPSPAPCPPSWPAAQRHVTSHVGPHVVII